MIIIIRSVSNIAKPQACLGELYHDLIGKSVIINSFTKYIFASYYRLLFCMFHVHSTRGC